MAKFDFASLTSQNNQYKMIPLESLVYNDEYERYDGERFNDMVQSIKKNGILQPLIVRTTENADKFVILSGNNRRYCGEAAGLTMFPCIVKENLTDEEAQAYIDETNVFQRGFTTLKITKQAEVVARRHSQMFDEHKLKAIQKEIALISGEDIPADDDEAEIKISKLAAVGQEYSLGQTTIARLIRIDMLVNELKEYVDDKTIAVRTAVELSWLSDNKQRIVATHLANGDVVLDMRKAEMLHKLEKENKLTEKLLEDVIFGRYKPKAPKPKGLKLSSSLVKRYFPNTSDEKEIEAVIETALIQYFNKSDE